MAGHTPWKNIKQKKSGKTTAVNIMVYDMGNNPLDANLITELQVAVANIIKKQPPTLAHSVVIETKTR